MARGRAGSPGTDYRLSLFGERVFGVLAFERVAGLGPFALPAGILADVFVTLGRQSTGGHWAGRSQFVHAVRDHFAILVRHELRRPLFYRLAEIHADSARKMGTPVRLVGQRLQNRHRIMPVDLCL
jgi:hypothetical protein